MAVNFRVEEKILRFLYRNVLQVILSNLHFWSHPTSIIISERFLLFLLHINDMCAPIHHTLQKYNHIIGFDLGFSCQFGNLANLRLLKINKVYDM